MTHFTHLIVVFDQRVYYFNGEKAVFFSANDGAPFFEDVWSNDCCKIVGIHLTP